MTTPNNGESAQHSSWADAKVVRWMVEVATNLATVSLVALLLTITVSVTARYFFLTPLLGSNEVLQLCLVALIATAMLPAVHSEIHIRVDVLDEHIGKYGRFLGDVLTRIVSSFVLIALAYRSALQAMDAQEFGDATNMLSIPIWPFYTLIVVGSFFYALVLVIQLIDIIRRGVSNHV